MQGAGYYSAVAQWTLGLGQVSKKVTSGPRSRAASRPSASASASAHPQLQLQMQLQTFAVHSSQLRGCRLLFVGCQSGFRHCTSIMHVSQPASQLHQHNNTESRRPHSTTTQHSTTNQHTVTTHSVWKHCKSGASSLSLSFV